MRSKTYVLYTSSVFRVISDSGITSAPATEKEPTTHRRTRKGLLLVLSYSLKQYHRALPVYLDVEMEGDDVLGSESLSLD